MKIGITMYETSFPTSDPTVRVPHYGSYPLTDALIYHDVTPLLLPSIQPNHQAIKRLADQIDGLILGGGDDIAPSTYGEAMIEPELTYPLRDRFEIALLYQVVKERKPVLGICRGCQMVNVALGGTLYQDIYAQIKRPLIEHDGSIHSVYINHHSELYRIMGDHQTVNSRHHQAIHRLGRGLTVVARAKDQIVEGIENSDALIQGVQWHPEDLWQNHAAQDNLFKAFFRRVQANSK